MSFPRKLPDLATLAKLRERGESNQQIADKYGVTAKSVSRAMHRARESARVLDRHADEDEPGSPQSGDDLVDKRLIYGELFDFMHGYDMTVMQMAMALQIETGTLRQILNSDNNRIRRSTAHRVVNAVMKYESMYGDPPDRYPLREFLRREA